MLHKTISDLHPQWNGRIEISYTPIQLLKSDTPPNEPRPYFGESKFYEKAKYGNEWLINLFLLQQHGIALTGPAFTTLRTPVGITLVQIACKDDLIHEWLPKSNDDQWMANSHYQSYLVLNLCRILNTIKSGTVLSKKQSAKFVKHTYPQWKPLVEAAEVWKYGSPFAYDQETKDFLSFVLKAIGAK